MEERKKNLEEFIKEELEKEAETIRRENASEKEGEDIPDEVRIRIRQGLQKEIDDYEGNLRYSGLSEKDRKALELGREILEKEETDKKVVRRKRGVRFYLGLAAVLVLVLAVSVTSFGGAGRVVRFVKGVVGEREVVKVNSGDENLIIVEEDEQEAYEIIEQKFGVLPVKILTGSLENMYFDAMEFDEELQIAELSYIYNEERVLYFINASYKDASWGVDVEDEVTDEYQMENKGCPIEVKEYETPDSGKKRYAARFEHQGLEYYLIGAVEKEKFELIIQSLFIYS